MTIKQRVIKWLGIEEILTLGIGLLRNEIKEQRDYDIAVRDRAYAQLLTDKVKEEITKVRSSPQRYVACPTCGKGFDMAGYDLHVQAISVVCDKCSHAFEVRPSLFWDKIEVTRRA